MNISAQHVAPEEVMALLDGELSSADTQAVSAHVEDCAECGKLAEQLRNTSRSLSAWKLPAIPMRLENAVNQLAAKAGSGVEIRNPKLFVRVSFWTWKQWAILSAGAVAALLFVAAIFMPVQYARHISQETVSSYVPAPSSKNEGVGGDRDKLRIKNGGAFGALIGGLTKSNIQSRNAQPRVAADQVPAPLIVRTVSLSIMVKDFASSRSSLDGILARYRGYSAQLTVSTTQNAPRSLQASLRIPAPVLSSAVDDLKRLGRVEREAQSGEEVTRQHEDLVARLKNSRDTEQRLREILQQRTGKIADVLKVEEEIARVRGEIEEMDAEQQALEHRVDFASVELQLAEDYKAQLNPPAASVSTRIHNAFVSGYQNASETVLGIVLFFAEYGPALLIWLALLAVPIVLIWRRYRRLSATV